jgi:uncharacterized membrane protein
MGETRTESSQWKTILKSELSKPNKNNSYNKLYSWYTKKVYYLYKKENKRRERREL